MGPVALAKMRAVLALPCRITDVTARWRAVIVGPHQGQPVGALNAMQSEAFMMSPLLRPGRRRACPATSIAHHQRPRMHGTASAIRTATMAARRVRIMACSLRSPRA
jgi:hypothetical protein